MLNCSRTRSWERDAISDYTPLMAKRRCGRVPAAFAGGLPFLSEQCAPTSESLVESHQLPLLDLAQDGVILTPPRGVRPSVTAALAREIVLEDEPGTTVHQAVLATLNDNTIVPAITDRPRMGRYHESSGGRHDRMRCHQRWTRTEG